MNENTKIILTTFFGSIIIITLWALSAFLIMHFFTDNNARGTFGDQFGAINALFSGLAFLGIIIAILLQKKELEEQRKEIRQSRIAHSESAKALTKQSNFSELSARINAINHVLDGLDRQIRRVNRSNRSDADTKIKALEEKQIEYESQLEEIISRMRKIEDNYE